MDQIAGSFEFDEVRLGRLNELLREVLRERVGLALNATIFDDELFLLDDLREAIRRLEAEKD